MTARLLLLTSPRAERLHQARDMAPVLADGAARPEGDVFTASVGPTKLLSPHAKLDTDPMSQIVRDVREPGELPEGLGLDRTDQRKLAAAAAQWPDLDPVRLRQQVSATVTAIPDPAVRAEIWRRARALWGNRRAERQPPERVVSPQMVERSEQALELVWVECLDDGGPALLVKAAGHKYLKRVPTGKQKPRWRYFYKLPGKRGQIVADEHVKETAKFRVHHKDREGHFEIVERTGDKIKIRHDETGREAHITPDQLRHIVTQEAKRRGKRIAEGKEEARKPKERAAESPDEHGWTRNADGSWTSPDGKWRHRTDAVHEGWKKQQREGERYYERRKKQEAEAKIALAEPKEKPPAAEQPKSKAPTLRESTMDEFSRGEWDNIEGFGDRAELEAAAVKLGGKDVAVIKQAGGWVLVSRDPRKAGKRKELVGTGPAVVKVRSAHGVEDVSAKWVVMEADDVIASHDPVTRQKRKDYPEGVQERRYDEVEAEGLKVERIAAKLDPSLVANTNPDGVNGTPIVSEAGVVLGGNGRTMGMQLAYKQHPDRANELREYLALHAPTFGLRAADVRAVKNPILVRRVETGGDRERERALGRRMNEALTQGLDPRSEEVALGRNYVRPTMMAAIAENIDPDEGLHGLLTSKRADPIIGEMRRSGMLDDYNAAQFLDSKTGRLNEEGRLRLERVLAARMVPDASLLDRMSPAVRQNIAAAVPHFARMEGAGWDLRDSLHLAAEADQQLREWIDRQGGKAGRDPVGAWQRQTDMEGNAVVNRVARDPAAGMLLRVVREHGHKPRVFTQALMGVAARAEQAGHGEGQTMGLFTAPEERGKKPSQTEVQAAIADALDIEFGITDIRRAQLALTKQAEREAKQRATSEVEAGRAQSSLFAASDRTMASLRKAMAGSDSPLVGRAILNARWFIDQAAQAQGAVDEAKVVRAVMDDVARIVDLDPKMAAAQKRQPVTASIVAGLVKMLVGMRLGGHRVDAERTSSGSGGVIAKALEKAERPSGGGWEPIPHGRHSGMRRRHGIVYEYWYPAYTATDRAIHPRQDESPAVHADHIEALRAGGKKHEAKLEHAQVIAQTNLAKQQWVAKLPHLPEDTQKHHQRDGAYTAERKALHDKIVRLFVDVAKPVPAHQKPVAIFMMGGPASGKTSAVKTLAGDIGNFVNVNPDDIKEHLPEYREATAGRARNAAGLAHEESSDVAGRVYGEATSTRRNLIMDGTGRNAGKYKAKIQALQKAGYHVHLIMADIDKGEAFRRMEGRAEKTGRYVPEHFFHDAHDNISPNFHDIASVADEATLISTMEKPPRVVWTRDKESKEQVHHEGHYQAFRERASGYGRAHQGSSATAKSQAAARRIEARWSVQPQGWSASRSGALRGRLVGSLAGRVVLHKAMSQRPPGTGWQAAPHSKHGALRKRVGDHWIYWMPGWNAVHALKPGEVHVGSPPEIGQKMVEHLPDVTPQAARHEAAAIWHTDEAVRAKKVAARVLLRFGDALSDAQKKAMDLDRVLKPLERQLARQDSARNMLALQEEARHAAKGVLDAARQQELRQTTMFAGVQDLPERNELSHDEVERRAKALHEAEQKGGSVSGALRALHEGRGPVEHAKVVHRLNELNQESARRRVSQRSATTPPKPARPMVAQVQLSPRASPAAQLALFSQRRGPLVLTLRKAFCSLELLRSRIRPPGGGWEPVPQGKHGGFRRRRGLRYEYWYPTSEQPQVTLRPRSEKMEGSANLEARLTQGWVIGPAAYADEEPHHQRHEGGAWTYETMHHAGREALLVAILDGDPEYKGRLEAVVPLVERWPVVTGDAEKDYENALQHNTIAVALERSVSGVVVAVPISLSDVVVAYGDGTGWDDMRRTDNEWSATSTMTLARLDEHGEVIEQHGH